MAEKIKTGEIRPPYGNFDIYEDVDRRTIYVDGVAAINVSAVVTKIDLFELGFSPVPAAPGKLVVLNAPGALPEERTVVVRIAMPTRALVEFCVNTLKGMQNSELGQLFDSDVVLMRDLVSSFELRK
jgi:hypothetical protein